MSYQEPRTMDDQNQPPQKWQGMNSSDKQSNNNENENSNNNNTKSVAWMEEQISALRQELLARDESIFDLQATLVTVEAETKHRIEQVQHTSQDEIRKLQEQLRRVQNEANRLQHKQQLRIGQQQMQQSTSSSSFSTALLSSRQHHSPHVPSNSLDIEKGSSNNNMIPEPVDSKNNQNMPNDHTGSRLAQQLLLLLPGCSNPDGFQCHASSCTNDEHAPTLNGAACFLQQGLSQILIRGSANPSSTTSSSLEECSDMDVVFWIMSEIITRTTTIFDHDHATNHPSVLLLQSSPQQRRTLELNPSAKVVVKELLLLFQCLQHAWTMSPRSCRFVIDTMMMMEHIENKTRVHSENNNNEESNPPIPPQHHPHHRDPYQRLAHFRIKSTNSDSQQQTGHIDDDIQHEQQHISFNCIKQRLQRVQEELQNPTWTLSPPNNNYYYNTNATAAAATTRQSFLSPTTATPVQIRFCQRFLEMLHSMLIMQSCSLNSLSLSVIVVQTWTFLCFYSRGSVATTLFQRNNNNNESSIDILLESWLQTARALVQHMCTQHQQPPTSHPTTSANASNRLNYNNSNNKVQSRSIDWIPLRILQLSEIQHHHEQQQLERSMSDANDPQNQNSNKPNHDDTRGLDGIFANEDTNQKEICFQMGLNWLAEILRLFRTIWHLRSQMRDNWLEDTSAGQAARLLACVLDVLEKVITPNESLQSHSLATECVVWMQALAAPQSATRGGMILLRMQRNTTRSTSELWHRAMSAIAVAVHLLNVIVIRQQYDDHIPTSTVALDGLKLTLLRDELVRFLHSVLQAVQEDRRLWERQDPDRQRKQRLVTFMGILSECQDYFTSAAAVLVSIQEHSNTICKVSPDIQAMLKLQLDELSMDHEEMMSAVT
jgi:hypothetical protein